MKLLVTALLLLTFQWALALDSYQNLPEGNYQLDKTHASLVWKVSHLGLSNYTARFTKFDASIDFNPEDITQSQVTATIDPLSIETDFPYPEEKDFDKKLSTGEDWFNGLNFRVIRFTSTKIEMTGDNTGVMTGDLTLLGITQPVDINFTLNGALAFQPFSKKPTLGFSAQTTLLRSNWGMDIYVPNIGDEVTVLIEAEFGKE